MPHAILRSPATGSGRALKEKEASNKLLNEISGVIAQNPKDIS